MDYLSKLDEFILQLTNTILMFRYNMSLQYFETFSKLEQTEKYKKLMANNYNVISKIDKYLNDPSNTASLWIDIFLNNKRSGQRMLAEQYQFVIKDINRLKIEDNTNMRIFLKNLASSVTELPLFLQFQNPDFQKLHFADHEFSYGNQTQNITFTKNNSEVIQQDFELFSFNLIYLKNFSEENFKQSQDNQQRRRFLSDGDEICKKEVINYSQKNSLFTMGSISLPNFSIKTKIQNTLAFITDNLSQNSESHKKSQVNLDQIKNEFTMQGLDDEFDILEASDNEDELSPKVMLPEIQMNININYEHFSPKNSCSPQIFKEFKINSHQQIINNLNDLQQKLKNNPSQKYTINKCIKTLNKFFDQLDEENSDFEVD